MTPAQVSELLVVVSSYWASFRPPDPARTVTAWFDALGDLDFVDAELAVRMLGRDERQFAPSPGEVRVESMKVAGSGCWVCGQRGSHSHPRLPYLPRREQPAALVEGSAD